MDSYEKFEHDFPFNQINIKAFENNVRVAEKACNNQGYVTLVELAKVFNTQAWADLSRYDSKLAIVLSSEAFKDKSKNQSEDEIDTNFLICYGLLLCLGEAKEKAEVFYVVLQEEGLNDYKWIAYSDRDYVPIIGKLCLLSTIHLFEFANKLSGIECPYKQNFNQIENVLETILEDWLTQVYEKESRLENEKWLSTVSKKSCSWIFKSAKLREKVLQQAGIKVVKF